MDARDGQALDVLPLGSVLACTHESGLLGSVKPYVSQRAVLPLGPYEMKTSSPSAMSLLAVKMNAPSSSLPGRGCEHRSQHTGSLRSAQRRAAIRTPSGWWLNISANGTCKPVHERVRTAYHAH